MKQNLEYTPLLIPNMTIGDLIDVMNEKPNYEKLPRVFRLKPLRTLEYLFAEHARLTISLIFSTLLTLNRSCSLNYFEEFFTLLTSYTLHTF